MSPLAWSLVMFGLCGLIVWAGPKLGRRLGSDRCSWCARPLRWWQYTHCRACLLHMRDAGIYLQSGGPPCPQGARRDAPADGGLVAWLAGQLYDHGQDDSTRH